LNSLFGFSTFLRTAASISDSHLSFQGFLFGGCGVSENFLFAPIPENSLCISIPDSLCISIPENSSIPSFIASSSSDIL